MSITLTARNNLMILINYLSVLLNRLNFYIIKLRQKKRKWPKRKLIWISIIKNKWSIFSISVKRKWLKLQRSLIKLLDCCVKERLI